MPLQPLDAITVPVQPLLAGAADTMPLQLLATTAVEPLQLLPRRRPNAATSPPEVAALIMTIVYIAAVLRSVLWDPVETNKRTAVAGTTRPMIGGARPAECEAAGVRETLTLEIPRQKGMVATRRPLGNGNLGSLRDSTTLGNMNRLN